MNLRSSQFCVVINIEHLSFKRACALPNLA
nr:MAG TPA: hypothetical protein [Caudoviricetes sp.]